MPTAKKSTPSAIKYSLYKRVNSHDLPHLRGPVTTFTSPFSLLSINFWRYTSLGNSLFILQSEFSAKIQQIPIRYNKKSYFHPKIQYENNTVFVSFANSLLAFRLPPCYCLIDFSELIFFDFFRPPCGGFA